MSAEGVVDLRDDDYQTIETLFSAKPPVKPGSGAKKEEKKKSEVVSTAKQG